MNIKVNRESLYESIRLLKRMNKNLTIDVNHYLNSPGICFLNKHLNRYGGSTLNKDVLDKIVIETMENPSINVNDNSFVKSMKYGLKYLSQMENEFNNLNIEDVIKKAVDKANNLLPNNLNENAKIYFLYGIRGTSIVYDKEIAVDICDEFVSSNGVINVNNLINIIAHELHHIGFDNYIKDLISKTIQPSKKLIISFIGELMSEGLMYYYLPNPYDKENVNNKLWEENLININSIINNINQYLNKLKRGEIKNIEDSGQFFDERLLGYSCGYIIIKTIDEKYGKDEVIKKMRDILSLLDMYNLAIADSNLNKIDY